MRVEAIASRYTDNFFYLVSSGDEALLVDPVDAELAVERARRGGYARVRVLTTHGHPDHVAGNDEVARALGAEVLAPAEAESWPVAHDVGLRHGDRIALGEEALEVIHAPGHTDCHLVYRCGAHLISGDVFFVGGAGNCRNGGDPGELYRTFHERLSHLPDAMTFYPGHDYAVRNLQFCLELEPENEGARELMERAVGRERSEGPFLLTLGEERSYNPFHRVADPALQELVAARDAGGAGEGVADPAERAFRVLRALRDNF